MNARSLHRMNAPTNNRGLGWPEWLSILSTLLAVICFLVIPAVLKLYIDIQYGGGDAYMIIIPWSLLALLVGGAFAGVGLAAVILTKTRQRALRVTCFLLNSAILIVVCVMAVIAFWP